MTNILEGRFHIRNKYNINGGQLIKSGNLLVDNYLTLGENPQDDNELNRVSHGIYWDTNTKTIRLRYKDSGDNSGDNSGDSEYLSMIENIDVPEKRKDKLRKYLELKKYDKFMETIERYKSEIKEKDDKIIEQLDKEDEIFDKLIDGDLGVKNDNETLDSLKQSIEILDNGDNNGNNDDEEDDDDDEEEDDDEEDDDDEEEDDDDDDEDDDDNNEILEQINQQSTNELNIVLL